MGRIDRTRARSFEGLCVGTLLLLLVAVPACGSSSTPAALATTTTTTSSSVSLPDQGPAETAACTANAQGVSTALAAYQAEHGAYPSPPAPWSAATYASNYQPLTAAGGGGPFMASAPKTTSYVIEYDAAGHVWVAPPGSYGPYNKGQDIAVTPNICDAAVG
ncbi:MAG: hypothetical protein WAL61_18955 [Acidimicrobiales bacterium]